MSLTAAQQINVSRLGRGTIGMALLAAAILAGACIGETPISVSVVIQTLANKVFGAGYVLDPIEIGIIWNYRLPRAIVAGCCGAGLAMSGLILQSLLRNALADPYLLGISAGASTGAVAVTIAGLGAGAISLSLGAFAGAVVAFLLVAMLARTAGGDVTLRGAGQIVLAGIAGSQLFNALTSLSSPNRPMPSKRAASCSGCSAISAAHAGRMYGLRFRLRSSAWPHASGTRERSMPLRSDQSRQPRWVRVVQVVLIGATALVTAVIVSIVGSIGFVGLVIPHTAAFWSGCATAGWCRPRR
jgi:iron complex transport system permease protein